MSPEGNSSLREEARRRTEQRKPYLERYGREIGERFANYALAPLDSVEHLIDLREKLIDSIAEFMNAGNREGRLWSTRALADLPSAIPTESVIANFTRRGWGPKDNSSTAAPTGK